MRTGGPQKDFSIVSSMTPLNGGNGLQHRSASSSSLQGEKERGDRGPVPRRSAADAASKKNGDQAKRARYEYTEIMKHPSIVPCMVKGALNTAGELRTAGPSLNMLNKKRSGRGPGHMWLRWPQAEFWSTNCSEHQHKCCTHTREWTWSWGESWLLVRTHSLGIDDATWLAEIRASELWSMGHRLLLQRLPAAWNCSFIQCYGKQVAGAAPAIVASYQQPNCTRAYTKSGCLLCASMRAQPGYRAAELCASDSAAEQSTKRPGCVSTLRWAGAVPIPALPPENNHWATAVYPHASTAAVPACVASRQLPAVDMYLHAYSGERAQHCRHGLYQDANSCSGITTLEWFYQLVDPVLISFRQQKSAPTQPL